MSRFAPHSVFGALVLAAGVVALGSVANDQSRKGETAEPAVVVESTQIEDHLPALNGIEPVIQRVLYDSGQAEVFSPGEVTDLPPTVARVLAYYEATLTIHVDDSEDKP